MNEAVYTQAATIIFYHLHTFDCFSEATKEMKSKRPFKIFVQGNSIRGKLIIIINSKCIKIFTYLNQGKRSIAILLSEAIKNA